MKKTFYVLTTRNGVEINLYLSKKKAESVVKNCPDKGYKVKKVITKTK